MDIGALCTLETLDDVSRAAIREELVTMAVDVRLLTDSLEKQLVLANEQLRLAIEFEASRHAHRRAGGGAELDRGSKAGWCGDWLCRRAPARVLNSHTELPALDPRQATTQRSVSTWRRSPDRSLAEFAGVDGYSNFTAVVFAPQSSTPTFSPGAGV